MAKVVLALGFGVSFVILAIAMTAGPQSSGIAAPEMRGGQAEAAMTAARCSNREIALDQGYGVSRKVTQRICSIAE